MKHFFLNICCSPLHFKMSKTSCSVSSLENKNAIVKGQLEWATDCYRTAENSGKKPLSSFCRKRIFRHSFYAINLTTPFAIFVCCFVYIRRWRPGAEKTTRTLTGRLKVIHPKIHFKWITTTSRSGGFCQSHGWIKLVPSFYTRLIRLIMRSGVRVFLIETSSPSLHGLKNLLGCWRCNLLVSFS